MALTNIVHAIRGTSASFDAGRAKACADRLEQAARSDQSADFQGMTESLVKAVKDLIKILLQAIKTKNQGC